MEADPDDEKMDDVRLNNKRQSYWRVVFGDNKGRLYDEKYIIHDKRWYVYMENKQSLIKGEYYVDFQVLTEIR